MAIQLITKTSEVKLIQQLNDLRASATGWTGVHFHLSGLLEEYKSEYQVKIALNLINDLLKTYEGTIYLMTDSSIMVLCRNIEAAVLEKLIFQLRYLYMDDPLAYNEAGQENPEFCSVYELKRHWQALYDQVTRLMTMFARKQPIGVQPLNVKVNEPPVERAPVLEKTAPEKPKVEEVKDKEKDKGGMSASSLVSIERDLRYADMHRVIRRQPVCAVLADMKIRRVFDELYIHIAHLRQILKSEVDFLSNRWLFKYLTHLLDERMIDTLKTSPGRYLDSPISLNLNVETLLSSRFAEFDAIVKPATRVSIVIEVPVVDVFADMAAFTVARQEVQKLGYRVCLDGLTAASFASINREQLGFDLVKVQWNAQSGDKSAENAAMTNAVQAAGSNRVILCRCDNRHAIEYGQFLGISLFQGRYIDSLLNPTSKVEN